ncbi:hypothetical protein CYMTET_30570 [Cymbomonas tetramitiformis]|uniref:Uncharacterized protein n=1 Tax=Cymbomonas tetramitiformis TaxID=36881 RepID=A0AAE0FIK7_9CHLO|nr:hypothetical protein CYMTET_30570 [Cymbomonas tetramitiformis]
MNDGIKRLAKQPFKRRDVLVRRCAMESLSETVDYWHNLLADQTSLDCEGTYVGKAGALALATALQHSSCKLRSLHLQYDGGGDASNSVDIKAASLASALQHPNCKLQTLYLEWNEVGEAGAAVLATALQHPNCTLRTLQLEWNEVGGSPFNGDAGAAAVATALQHPNCMLHTLHLEWNGVGEAGAASLATALRNQNCKLQMLHLGGCTYHLASFELMERGVQGVITAWRHLSLWNEVSRVYLSPGVGPGLLNRRPGRNNRLASSELMEQVSRVYLLPGVGPEHGQAFRVYLPPGVI